MNLTRRGRFVAGIAAVAFFWAAIFRLHTLNAVVVSSTIALAVGALLVRRAAEPNVRRFAPQAGHVGDRRRIAFQLRCAGAPSGTVIDTLPERVRAVDGDNHLDRVLDGNTIEYEVVADRRGIHRLGPLTVTVTDPLGLVTRSFEVDATVDLVTYPPVYELTGLGGLPLDQQGGASRERNEFDRVREYTRGDPLRDIHWRSTAKQPDEIIVKEFMARTRANRAQIVGESEPGAADEMATATASLAMTLMNDGIEVGVILADEEVPIEHGQPHRARLLEALARTEGGRVGGEATEQHIRVRAPADDGPVQVILGNQSIPFDDLRRESLSGRRAADSDAEPGATTAVAADGGTSR